MPYPSEHSCRLLEPIEGAKTRRKNGEREHNGKKYDVIYQEQEDGAWADQAYRYPVKTWDESEAKTHCQDHDGTFEPASDDAGSQANLPAEGNFSPHIAMQVFNTPLMILPSKLDVIVRVLGGRIGVTGGSVDKAEMVSARPAAKSGKSDVAVVPIIGSLVHRTSGLDALSGLTSYTHIRSNFRQAMSDPGVGAILLDIDSPGGQVAGVFDLADEIRAANEQKPVYAFINEGGYSAAYLLASAAKKIFLPRTGGVGSIGIRMMHVDESEMNKKAGIKYTDLYVGERKIDFSPNMPLSTEARKAAMNELHELYDLFAETVATHRGLEVADVKGTEAALYRGHHAVKIGLADEVMSLDEAVDFILEDMAMDTKPQAARKGATKKEVKRKMANTNIADFKAENPELYEDVRKSVEQDLKTSFDAERSGFEAKISGLETELQKKETRILKLEKSEYIRTTQEKKDRIDAAADRIWTRALATCDIPEGMHAKVKVMVPADAYVKEDVLDEDTYAEAVQREIAEWEGKGMTTTVLGAGFGGNKTGNEGEAEAKQAQKEEEEDDEWVREMHALAGQKAEGGES